MRSSAAPSRPGSPGGSGPSRPGGGASGGPPRRGRGGFELLEAWDRGVFPATFYLEGPCEPLKAVLLAELRRAWAAHCPESPSARVLRAAESNVAEILAAFQSTSLFSPRDLTIVLEVEDLGKSDKRVQALAAGLSTPAGGSCLALVESAAESPRKSLDPVRSGCAAHRFAAPPGRAELRAWGERNLARERLTAEAGVVEALVESCEGDPLAFFNELDKLCTWVAARGSAAVRGADVAALLAPQVGADLPDYLAAVAAGDAGAAARRLGRLLAAGVSEGSVLFALANLVGGSLGGWARHREASDALRRRLASDRLARAQDAVYRAESAWKGGRADAVALLEQATRAVARGD